MPAAYDTLRDGLHPHSVCELPDGTLAGVHEGGWTLTMTGERIATWIRPDGTIHHTLPTIDRAPHGIAS